MGSDGIVVIKFGGGLITNKSVLKTPDTNTIAALANVVAQLHRQPSPNRVRVVVVHGAGSFGHLVSKAWRLAEGYLGDDFDIDVESDRHGCQSQMEAMVKVREDMMELNGHVCDALTAAGLQPMPFPPHEWATGRGPRFEGSLDGIQSALLSTQHAPWTVPVTFGDVVDVLGPSRFGILSGDDIVVRLACEIPHVRRLVFAIRGVDGVLRVPPERAKDDDLITEWTPDTVFEGATNAAVDVTGGIFLKVDRGLLVAASGLRVVMVNGDHPERILAACVGDTTRGTFIHPPEGNGIGATGSV